MKKVIALLLTALLCCSMFMTIPAFASEEMPSDTEIAEKEAKISALYDERLDAQVAGDTERFQEITIELEELGVERITKEEAYKIFNLPTPRYVIDKGDELYEKYSLDRRIDGKYYTYMTIIITPKVPTHYLVHTGSFSQTMVEPKRATEAEFINLAFSILGNLPYMQPVSWGMTLYDLAQLFIENVDPAATVSNIGASYTWNITEVTANYFMASETVPNMYIPIGMSNQVKGWIGGTILSWSFDSETGGIAPEGMQYSYELDYSPSYFPNGGSAIEQYIKEQELFEERMKSIEVRGVDNDIVYEIPLAKGYWEA